jgi:hypothetical protein
MVENIQHEFFIWDEKSLIEHQKNCENKSVSETKDIIKNTQVESTQTKWQNITNPKLRRKVREKLWRETNKDKRKVYEKTYRDLNKDKIKVVKRSYRKLNRDKINKIKRNYRKHKLNTDIQYKLSELLRGRLRNALKGICSSGSAVEYLGCTIPELKSYLESKFLPDMTWNNWSFYGWHIDHIKPLASFDLTVKEQLLEACHYTNLQPLWAKDNLSKGSKLSHQILSGRFTPTTFTLNNTRDSDCATFQPLINSLTDINSVNTSISGQHTNSEFSTLIQ